MSEPGKVKDLQPFIVRLLLAAAIFTLLWLAWYLRGLFMLAFGAVLVAVILHLIARPIHERLRLQPRVALMVAALLVVAVFSVAFWVLRAEVATQTRSLERLIPLALQSFQTRLESWGLGGILRQMLNDVGLEQGVAGRFALTLGTGLADTLLVLVGGIYLAAQPKLYRTGIVKLVPVASRGLVAEALDESGKALGLWLKGRLVSMALVGLLTGLGLWVIGVPSALSLALLSALLEFIPFIGPILAAIPAVLLALAHSPEAALWTALLYFIVQQLEGNVVEPLVQQQAVMIPPALLLFALVGAGFLFGIIGILLGAPLTVVLYMLVKQLYVREALGTETPLPTERKE